MLFSSDYYSKIARIYADADVLFRHYESLGWKEGLPPSPYFDVEWYLSCNPEVEKKKIEPLSHFVAVGAKKFADPHPLFDSRWYAAQYLEGEAGKVVPVEHYITTGWKLGNSPHPLFWPAWYVETYLKDIAGFVDPFYHYISEGWKAGCNPNPLFDAKLYISRYSSGGSDTPDPLSHYVHIGCQRGFDPHPLFNTEYYSLNTGFFPETAAHSALHDYLYKHSEVSPHPVFDSEFFLRQMSEKPSGPPLIAYLTDPAAAELDPHPLFSKKYYAKQNPGEDFADIDPLVHYVTKGWVENRETHPLISGKYYVNHVGTKIGISPLEHYLLMGIHEGKSIRPQEIPDTTLKRPPQYKRITAVPSDVLLDETASETVLKDAKIGVFAHIFYPNLAEEMIRYCNNITGNAIICISTDAESKRACIQKVCEVNSKHPFEIRVTPNRGRDIAPMLVGFRDKLLEVDYALHIHSKKSLHAGSLYSGWREYLLEQLLGTEELVTNILTLLSSDKVGAYAPDHFGVIKDFIQWGGNAGTMSTVFEMFGNSFTKEQHLDFPSGSMFWFKTAAMQKLFGMNLCYAHFEPELGQVDGTLAHVIERLFFYLCEFAGYGWITGRSVLGAAAVTAKQHLDTLHGEWSLLSNRIIVTTPERGALSQAFNECTSFLPMQSAVAKPRINLLIPTVDTKQAYAGVSTALSFFKSLSGALGDSFDSRIISTDISFGSSYVPPEGYSLAAEDWADKERTHVVQNAAKRWLQPFGVRKNDIFVATSWWAAHVGFSLLNSSPYRDGYAFNKLIYLIQDFEPGFYPWSTKYMLSRQTYCYKDKTIAVFNSPYLLDFFKANKFMDEGYCLCPSIPESFLKNIQFQQKKERVVLLYARPHAVRNCLDFIDALVLKLYANDPVYWKRWKFIAVGENMPDSTLRSSAHVTVLGRLSMQGYADIASRSALAVSLMVSPHPSYPPLEMAEAGVLVLTNGYDNKNLEDAHDNITSMASFDIDTAVTLMTAMAERWEKDNDIGWQGKSKNGWFSGGRTNQNEVSERLAQELREALGVS